MDMMRNVDVQRRTDLIILDMVVEELNIILHLKNLKNFGIEIMHVR